MGEISTNLIDFHSLPFLISSDFSRFTILFFPSETVWMAQFIKCLVFKVYHCLSSKFCTIQYYIQTIPPTLNLTVTFAYYRVCITTI